MNEKEKIIEEFESHGWEFITFEYIELVKIGEVNGRDVVIKNEKRFENGVVCC